VDLLLDTHVLLWAASAPEKLSGATNTLLEDPDNCLYFSAVSIWEVAVKQGLGRTDFSADAAVLRRALLAHDYHELPVTGRHAALVTALPQLHRDPFDRMLVTQAMAEGLVLVTNDAMLAKYAGVNVQVSV
jgi:PIN domain nuclease of toxin-antitoxin system